MDACWHRQEQSIALYKVMTYALLQVCGEGQHRPAVQRDAVEGAIHLPVPGPSHAET